MVFFFQAEDGIRDLVRSRGLGDVYKRQGAQKAAVSKKSASALSSRGVRSFLKEGNASARPLSLIHI